MMRRMSAEEFATWRIIHAKLNPFGERGAALLGGRLLAPIINLLRSVHVKYPTMVAPHEFLWSIKPPRQQTDEEIKMIFKGLADSAKIREAQLAKMAEAERLARQVLKNRQHKKKGTSLG